MEGWSGWLDMRAEVTPNPFLINDHLTFVHQSGRQINYTGISGTFTPAPRPGPTRTKPISRRAGDPTMLARSSRSASYPFQLLNWFRSQTGPSRAPSPLALPHSRSLCLSPTLCLSFAHLFFAVTESLHEIDVVAVAASPLGLWRPAHYCT